VTSCDAAATYQKGCRIQLGAATSDVMLVGRHMMDVCVLQCGGQPHDGPCDAVLQRQATRGVLLTTMMSEISTTMGEDVCVTGAHLMKC